MVVLPVRLVNVGYGTKMEKRKRVSTKIATDTDFTFFFVTVPRVNQTFQVNFKNC